MRRNLGQPFNRMPEDRDREFRELEQRLADKANPPQKITNPLKMEIPRDLTEVTSFKKYWSIPNVIYQNGIYTMGLLKEPLCQGEEKTQQAWIKFDKVMGPLSNFCTANMPTHHAIFRALYEQRNNPEAKKAKEFIKEKIREGIATLTSIHYHPSWTDNVNHYPHPELITENMVGPTRQIEIEDGPALEALLGTKDISEISEIYSWINQTPTWIHRIMAKTSKKESTMAIFASNNHSIGLDCCYDNQYTEKISLGIAILSKDGSIK